MAVSELVGKPEDRFCCNEAHLPDELLQGHWFSG